jgi:hypothetical protein
MIGSAEHLTPHGLAKRSVLHCIRAKHGPYLFYSSLGLLLAYPIFSFS